MSHLYCPVNEILQMYSVSCSNKKKLDAIETENYLNKFSITSTQKITSHTYFQGFDFKADS